MLYPYAKDAAVAKFINHTTKWPRRTRTIVTTLRQRWSRMTANVNNDSKQWRWTAMMNNTTENDEVSILFYDLFSPRVVTITAKHCFLSLPLCFEPRTNITGTLRKGKYNSDSNLSDWSYHTVANANDMSRLVMIPLLPCPVGNTIPTLLVLHMTHQIDK